MCQSETEVPQTPANQRADPTKREIKIVPSTETIVQQPLIHSPEQSDEQEEDQDIEENEDTLEVIPEVKPTLTQE